LITTKRSINPWGTERNRTAKCNRDSCRVMWASRTAQRKTRRYKIHKRELFQS
jgi:hypothetical protein